MWERRARIVEPPTPSRTLFWVFVASTVGLFTVSALLIRYFAVPQESMFSNARLWRLICVEGALAGLWLPILRRRGWSLASVTESPAIRDVARAAGLVVSWFCASWFVLFVAFLAAPGLRASVEQAALGGHPWWGTILAASIVNPIAEEFLFLGFLTNVLRRHGEPLAVGASVLARMGPHLYQSAGGVVAVAVFGLTLGVYYFRSRRLGPPSLPTVLWTHLRLHGWRRAERNSAAS